MKFIREYWREAACVVLGSGFFYFVPWLRGAESSVERMWAVVCMVADAIVLIMLLRSLWRLKWRRAFVSAVQGVMRTVAKFFMRIAEKIAHIMGRDRKNVIYGKNTFHSGI